MEKLFSYFLVALGVILMFGASIFVHELGHYWMARRRGMKVEAFAIGLGPKIFGRVRDGVEWSVRWIPAGGFVRLPQMITSEALEGGSGDGKALPPAPPASKILVAVAGPLMNLVFAFLVATVIYFVGLPVLVNPSVIGKVDPESPEGKMGIREGDRIVEFEGRPVKTWQQINERVVLARTNVFTAVIERDGERKTYQLSAKTNPNIGLKWLNLDPFDHPIVGAVETGRPADLAGLKPGDRFLYFDDVPVISQEHLRDLVARSEGKESVVVVDRNGQQISARVTPIYDPEVKRGRIGIVFAGGVYEVMRPGPTPWMQFYTVVDRTVSTIAAVIHSRETGVKARDFSGPLGILASMAVEAKTDYRRALNFLVLLNVSLAILNLLPIPVLDGGHILMAILEQLRGKPLSLRFVEYTTTAFALLLISFMLYVTFFDMRRLPLFWALFQRGSQVETVIQPGAAVTNMPPSAPAPAP
ncbi:MAG: RIP metalloprotease RseP [Verrucomicrobia bacterium]|nr:RIP metalloprotease RseP [Verrucomicrobiota bacterium]